MFYKSLNGKCQFIIITLSVLALTAAGCGKSQNGLAKTAKNTQKIAKFQKCCALIKDQTVIGDIVLDGDTWGRRRTALDYVTDPVVLERIITSTKEFDIGSFAQDRLDAIRNGTPLEDVSVINWVYFDKTGKPTHVSKAKKATWDQCMASVGKKLDPSDIKDSRQPVK